MQKRLIVVAASALSTVAFAQNNKQKPPTNNALAPDICEICTNDVVVKGPQIQVTTVQSSASIADTDNGSTANNMLSNTNGVLLKGRSGRITALSHTGALAHANDGSYAQDKLTSTIGSVDISEYGRLQVMAATCGSFMGAMANNGSRAIQNFPTNNACVDYR